MVAAGQSMQYGRSVQRPIQLGANAQVLNPPAFLMLVVSVIVTFMVSPYLLQDLGLGYGDPAAPAWHKLHPSVPLIVIALLLGSREALRSWRKPWAKGLGFYLCAVLLWMAYTAGVLGLPITTGLITYLSPLGLLLLLARMSEAQTRSLSAVVLAIVMANSLLGLYEYITGWRFTTFIINGWYIYGDLRSTSFFGHPLINGAALGSFVVIMMSQLDRRSLEPLELGTLAIAASSMVSFGARAATVAAAVISIVYIVRGQWLAAKVSIITKIFFVLLLVGGFLAGSVAYEKGYFDTFLERFFEDAGSADTRLAALDIFFSMSWSQFFWGDLHGTAEGVLSSYGSTFGLENYWIALIFFTGLLAAGPVFISLFLYLRSLGRATGTFILGPAIFFLLIISSSLSLASKSQLLSMFTVLVMAFCRKVRPRGMPS